MEESMILNGETNVITELSDSTSSSRTLPASKRARHANIISSKFKGVVPQQNGHWGAQIYANHQRIWLGTFKTEKEAAMAYDSAAIRLRSADSHRNFPWTSVTAQEPHFQSSLTTEAMLNMIRDGSYESKFAEYLRNHSGGREKVGSLNHLRSQANGWLMCRQLFQKELTPSDVGKLNRLVIPKKYAIKYFPTTPEGGEEREKSEDTDDVQLVFYDRSMRLWKFRYCYWRSSQSFVFTRGWNRFVKEHQLKANDTISFYMCECKDKAKTSKSFCMIDANKGENNGSMVGMSNNIQYVEMQMDLKLQLGQNGINIDGDEDQAEENEGSSEQSLKHAGELKPFKLFGVQII